MSILSITFHTTEDTADHFISYSENELPQIINNLMHVEKYYFSEVESDYINDGKNYNLLLFFDTEKDRAEFILSEFENISDLIGKRFGESVMIFQTKLNLQHYRN